MKHFLFCLLAFLLIGCSQSNSIKLRDHFDSEIDSILYDYRIFYSQENLRRHYSDSAECVLDSILKNKFYYVLVLYQWDSKSRMTIWGCHYQHYALSDAPVFFYEENKDTVLIYQSTRDVPDTIYSKLFKQKNLHNGNEFYCPYMVNCEPFCKEYEYDGTRWILVDAGRDIGKWYAAELKEKFEDYTFRFDSLIYMITQEPRNPDINSHIFNLILDNSSYFVEMLHEHPEIKKRVLLEVSHPKSDSIDIEGCIGRLEHVYSKLDEEKELIDILKKVHSRSSEK